MSPPFLLFHFCQLNSFTQIPVIPIPITMQQYRISYLNPFAQPFIPQNNNTPPPPRRGTVKNNIPFPKTVEEAKKHNVTSVMIRNIPNQFRFEDLLHVLDEHCFEINKTADDPAEWSKFDFLYLPVDYRKYAEEREVSNLGYAFVNFTTPSAAFKFYKQFQGFAWNVTKNHKICEINVAKHQGKETLVRIFSQKVFRCESRKFLPVAFFNNRDGLNRRMRGTPLGLHVRGLPFGRTNFGICAFDQNVPNEPNCF